MKSLLRHRAYLPVLFNYEQRSMSFYNISESSSAYVRAVARHKQDVLNWGLNRYNFQFLSSSQSLMATIELLRIKLKGM